MRDDTYWRTIVKKLVILWLLFCWTLPGVAADWLQPPTRVAADGSGWKGKILGESWSGGLFTGYMFMAGHTNPVDGQEDWLDNPMPNLGPQFGIRGRIFFGRIGIGLSVVQLESYYGADPADWATTVDSSYYQYYYYIWNNGYDVKLTRWLVEPMLLYRIPLFNRVQVYGGIGPAIQLVRWSAVKYSTGEKVADQLNGSLGALGFTVRTGLEFFLGSWISLSLEINYRYWNTEFPNENFQGISAQSGIDFWF